MSLERRCLMKSLLKCSGFLSCLFALVAFILLMVTPSVVYNLKISDASENISGLVGIFGGSDAQYGMPWAGILAWVLSLVALLILVVTVVLPVFDVKVLGKFKGLLNLIAAILLVVAGVFAFFELTAFKSANDTLVTLAQLTGSYSLGIGWIISGILFIIAGLFALLPVINKLLAKK